MASGSAPESLGYSWAEPMTVGLCVVRRGEGSKGGHSPTGVNELKLNKEN
jgi:hypothetical protein